MDYYYKEKFGGSDNYLNRVIENSSVLAVTIDKQENLWISTLLKGVFVYHPENQKAEPIVIEGLPAGEKKNSVNHVPNHISSQPACTICCFRNNGVSRWRFSSCAFQR